MSNVENSINKKKSYNLRSHMIHLGVFYFQFFTFKFIDEFVVQNNLLAKRNVRDYIH